jgi:hypothetical protein
MAIPEMNHNDQGLLLTSSESAAVLNPLAFAFSDPSAVVNFKELEGLDGHWEVDLDYFHNKNDAVVDEHEVTVPFESTSKPGPINLRLCWCQLLLDTVLPLGVIPEIKVKGTWK